MKEKTFAGNNQFNLKLVSNKKQCIGCFEYIENLKSTLCLECRSCRGKVAFSSRSAALATNKWYKDHSSPYLFEYNCIYCGLFHLTSSNNIEEAV
tara:strand:+ start:99 stop:383 length:285 start_codon:yes stop_codon:yes gene_type:complete